MFKINECFLLFLKTQSVNKKIKYAHIRLAKFLSREHQSLNLLTKRGYQFYDFLQFIEVQGHSIDSAFLGKGAP